MLRFICRLISTYLCVCVCCVFSAVAWGQRDADTYRNRPFYTYDLHDALDGYDYGTGYYGGADYLHHDGDYVFDRDRYGDVYDTHDYGGYDYLGYDPDFNLDARDHYLDEDAAYDFEPPQYDYDPYRYDEGRYQYRLRPAPPAYRPH